MASTKNNFFLVKGICASISNAPKRTGNGPALKVVAEISTKSASQGSGIAGTQINYLIANPVVEFFELLFLLETRINFRWRLNHQQEFRSCIQANVLSG